jgi:hypothetical protein
MVDGMGETNDISNMLESNPRASFSSPLDLVNLIDTISYFLHLKMASSDKNTNFRVPAGIDKIIEIARCLPVPTSEEWGSLAVGRISTKRKFRVSAAEEVKSSKKRATWTEDAKKELVELVENDDLRREKLGERANHNGHINWASLARRYGFSGAGPVYRQYESITGKKPPGVKQAKRRSEDPGDASDPELRDHQKCGELIRLVQNDAHRRSIIGTVEVDWKLIGRQLGVSGKIARAKYEELTGSFGR